MVAPIDARATFEAAGETFQLAMNYRTIALAEDAKPDVVTAFGTGKPTITGMTTLVWAFAQPAHPDLTLDQALAIVMQHSDAAGSALGECFHLGTKGAAAPDDADANPPETKTSG